MFSTDRSLGPEELGRVKPFNQDINILQLKFTYIWVKVLGSGECDFKCGVILSLTNQNLTWQKSWVHKYKVVAITDKDITLCLLPRMHAPGVK